MRAASSLSGPRLIAVSVFLLLACGKRVATVKLGAVPGTSDIQLDMPTGRALKFDLYVEKYERQGENELRLQVSLLRGGAVVASTECSGASFRGRSSGGCQSTFHNSCPITAPDGGADTVRVATRFAKPTPITLVGLELRVHE